MRGVWGLKLIGIGMCGGAGALGGCGMLGLRLTTRVMIRVWNRRTGGRWRGFDGLAELGIRQEKGKDNSLCAVQGTVHVLQHLKPPKMLLSSMSLELRSTFILKYTSAVVKVVIVAQLNNSFPSPYHK